jgi:hypothetical protein
MLVYKARNMLTANDLKFEDDKIIPLQQDLLESELSSELSKFVKEAIETAQRHPEIEAAIEHDLYIDGLKAKAEREADKRFYEQQNPSFEEFAALAQPETCPCVLEEGRPRMSAIVAFVLLLLRGWLGGPKSSDFQLVLNESITLRAFFDAQGIKIPAASTISDNLNAISKETSDGILICQLRTAKEDDLDTFDEVIIDSTACSSNSKYPTDSGLMAALAIRLTGLFERLKKLNLGLPNWVTRKSAIKAKEVANEIEGYAKRIDMLSGKRKVVTERNALYAKIFTRVERLSRVFRPLFAVATTVIENTPMPPSRMRMVTSLIEQTWNDLENMQKIRAYSQERIFEDKAVEAKFKIYSISDDAAAIIKKGGWDNVLGYRPQLAFSGKGLVTAHHTPRGNAADSGQLAIIVEANEYNTGVVPKVVSLDDGYTNGKVRIDYLAKHPDKVEVFSFAGAKGRNAIGDEVYDSEPYVKARAKRSAAESRIFTLKYNHDYGQLSRRGMDGVNGEQDSKILAYNIRRMIRLREDKARQQREAALKLAA